MAWMCMWCSVLAGGAPHARPGDEHLAARQEAAGGGEQAALPTWFDPRIPARDNLGRSDGANLSVFAAALTAVQKGNKKFVPERATK